MIMVRKGLTDVRRLSLGVTSGSHARAVTGVVTVKAHSGSAPLTNISLYPLRQNVSRCVDDKRCLNCAYNGQHYAVVSKPDTNRVDIETTVPPFPVELGLYSHLSIE